MTEHEIWKSIDGFPDYKISSIGNVYSIKNRSLLKLPITGFGYHRISLYKNKKAKAKHVHRLVAAAFIGKSDLPVNHINGIKTDNRVKNLEYLTLGQNRTHAAKIDLVAFGEKHGSCKIKEEDVIYILKNYKRISHKNSNLKALARKFNISPTQVTDIKNGKRWKRTFKKFKLTAILNGEPTIK